VIVVFPSEALNRSFKPDVAILSAGDSVGSAGTIAPGVTLLRMLRLYGIGLAACALALPARAADVAAPVYRPAAVIAPYSWTGCYLGAEGGGAWGTTRHDAAGAPTGQTITGDFAVSGSVLGGTAGCNYQAGSHFVFGIEDDFSWTNLNGSVFDAAPFDPNTISATKQNWIDTLRGRAGIAWDRWLGYLTGGAAFTGTSVSVCNSIACVSDSRTRAGWTVGAGVEYELIGNWTVKLEYLYANFGTAQYVNPAVSVPGGFTVLTRDVPLSESIARIGVNYKFGAAPFDARY
jgi:outer membrane immunogenic protein